MIMTLPPSTFKFLIVAIVLLSRHCHSFTATVPSVSVDKARKCVVTVAMSVDDTADDLQHSMVDEHVTRRSFSAFVLGSFALAPPTVMARDLSLDVNNAVAREFTAFPGLYPTIATKLVNAAKREPFTSKKQIYEVLSLAEQERLREYDRALVIVKPDKNLQQFKASQICKYECKSRVSNAYRDEQIRQVQANRR